MSYPAHIQPTSGSKFPTNIHIITSNSNCMY